MPIIQAGSINIAALQVPGLYIQIVPPQLVINGVPTNVVGGVGTASWGAVNAPTAIGSYAGYAGQFGDMVPRKYDLGTHVWNAYQQGGNVVVQAVRVTDGTDTAATAAVQTSCMTLTSKYTGSRGNQQSMTLSNGAAANSIRASLFTPGVLPEVFDSITKGVHTVTVTAGTGFTSVPAASVAASDGGGVNAQVNATLAVTGTPTVGAGGTGYAAGDFITLSNGVVVKVATVNTGAVATLQPITTTGCNAGSVTGAGTAVPASPVAQVSTTGVGTGATINLVWGLGPAVVTNPGTLYTTASPAITLTGGGGTGGSYSAAISYWPNIVNAINLGQGSQRGPSLNFVATLGTATTAPVLATTTLTGGTDGAAVTSAALVGSDSLPRKGMYALRGLGCSVIDLADCDDITTFANQVAFGLFEGAYMLGVTPLGDTLSNAATELSTAGIDSYAMKVMFGDWVYINDTINNQVRLTSPQGFILGLQGNLAPNQSTLNKQLQGIVGTQKSSTGVQYTNADLQTLVTARMDVIANPSPGGAYFAAQIGHNSSSNAAIHGDNYTRMTNFLAATLAKGLGIYVGTLGTPGQARRLKSTIDDFFSNVQYQAKLIGDPDNPGAPPAWSSSVSLAAIAIGIEQATVQVQYQGIAEVLVVSVIGGQTVTIQRSVTPSAN
jgi:hypothetical protein